MLFSVACCRRIWHCFKDERSRQAVKLAERWADGRAVQAEVVAAFHAAVGAERDREDANAAEEAALTAACWVLSDPAWNAAVSVALYAGLVRSRAANETSVLKLMEEGLSETQLDRIDWFARGKAEAENAADQEWRDQTVLLRCIFGSPFHPAITGTAPWLLDRTVRTLARSIYVRRGWQTLPVLADVLEAAGCDDREIIQHCRSGLSHARGCWVLDLLLGKEPASTPQPAGEDSAGVAFGSPPPAREGLLPGPREEGKEETTPEQHEEMMPEDLGELTPEEFVASCRASQERQDELLKTMDSHGGRLIADDNPLQDRWSLLIKKEGGPPRLLAEFQATDAPLVREIATRYNCTMNNHRVISGLISDLVTVRTLLESIDIDSVNQEWPEAGAVLAQSIAILSNEVGTNDLAVLMARTRAVLPD